MMNHVKRILLASSIVLLGLAAPATSAMAATAPATAHVTPAAAADSSFALHNTWTDKCADLPNAGAPNPNTPVTQYFCNYTSADNQLWTLRPTRSVNGVELYEIVQAKGGLCLDLPNYGSDPAGTHVYVYNCNANPANDNQEWGLVDVTGDADYAIVNYKDGLCLDVSGWAAAGTDRDPNLPLTVYTCYNSSWANGGYDDHIWDLDTAS